MHVAIVKSLIGTPDSPTKAVNISHIPVLYNDLITTLKISDFATSSFLFEVCMYLRMYVCMYL